MKMKSCFAKLLIFGLFVLFSCNEYERITPANWGSAEVTLNEKPFERFFSNGTVSIMGFETSDSCTQHISIALSVVSQKRPQNMLEFRLIYVPKSRGRYGVGVSRNDCSNKEAISVVGSTLIDYDMLGSTYKALQSDDSYLEIISYDEKTGEIKGNFQVTLVVDNKVDHSNFFGFPDTLHCVGTAFHTKHVKK